MQTIVGAKTSSFSAISVPRSQFSARKSIAATQRIIIQSSSSSQKKLNNNKRNSALVVRAEGGDDDGFEVPDFVKDLMKPPDASVAAPAWLEPLLGLAKESGDSAVGIGYALMIVTSVFFSLIFALIGLPGPLVFLMFAGSSGYTCWQATPYLNEIANSAMGGSSSSSSVEDDSSE
mmetsp:Transcript_3639/g.11213  ORF Transcript_3639/g.11213 Transcript_3639/m.11213 type:complete len:176 (+) Transcript_3639:71-598(+)